MLTKFVSGGWVEYKYRLVFNPVPPNPVNVDFVTILPATHVKHNFRQIAHVANGKKTFLTMLENAEVTDILQWTTDGKTIRFVTLVN